jgi:Na+/melibiose symporter-like transporter
MTRQSSLALARLGLPALPLAFVALPLYMVWPHHVATNFGLSLGLLGGLLFVVRLLDGLLDPLIGHAVDGLLVKGAATLLRRCLLAGMVLALSFIWLFFPQWLLGPTLTMDALLVLMSVLLLCAYLAYSFLNIALQAWGAGIAGDNTERSRLVGWREGLGLLGVISASVLPGLWGLPVLVTVFVLLLALGLWAWWWAPRPTVVAAVNSGSLWRQLLLPWGHAGFRRLLQVFMLNGIASAVPATLILFFVQDRLQMSNTQTTLFVAAYFIAAALSMPLWLRAMARWGLRRCWLWGMGLAIAVFIWTLALSAGDELSFLTICILSGVALGSDLIAPGALLNGLLQRPDAQSSPPGAYFGWWQVASKFNLALAAGVSLPLLQALGYSAGAQDAPALLALSLAYGLLPCLLKAAAWWLLYKSPSHFNAAEVHP